MAKIDHSIAFPMSLQCKVQLSTIKQLWIVFYIYRIPTYLFAFFVTNLTVQEKCEPEPEPQSD